MDKKADKLIEALSAKTPDEQRKAAMNMLGSMNPEQSSKIKEIMADKEKLQSILSSPQAQQLINKLKGKQ
ncbi:MAG: hypothetical protein IJZ57_08560 [Clostridia bacterium]|nr:hypothetical protein [Clostridia bacterium]